MMTPLHSPLVEMTGITVTYPGVIALQDVDLRLYPGEVHALVGENGAGKSSLVKVLAGVRPVDRGQIRIDGVVCQFRGVAASRAAGIAPVFQGQALAPNLSVAENVFVGQELHGRFGINWRATRQRALGTLEEMGLGYIDPRLPLSRLSSAEQQRVAVARALVGHPRIVALDQPTSGLEHNESNKLLADIAHLRDRGVAILLVPQSIEQVYSLCDRVTVLRDGHREGEYLTQDLDRTELISKMIGKDISVLRRTGSRRRAHHHEPISGKIYSATGIGKSGELEPTDIELYRGEIVAFAGLQGSGRTALAHLISGAAQPDSGRSWVDGRSTTISSPSAGLRHGIAMSNDDQQCAGALGDLSVQDNIVLALQTLRGWSQRISRNERDALVATLIDGLDIRPATPRTPMKHLSGGAQQKVLLARLLATRPKILILSEPTLDIDVAAKGDIEERISRLAGDGVAVVLITSELDDAVRICDRIVVLKDRAKIGEVNNGPGVNADTIVELIASEIP